MSLITRRSFLFCSRVRGAFAGAFAGAFDFAFFDLGALRAILFWFLVFFFFLDMIGQSEVVCVVFNSVVGKAGGDRMNSITVSDV